MGKVTIYLTRHAESTANFNSKYPNDKLDRGLFRDAALSPYGLDSVVYWRNNKLSKIGNVDYIFASPMKRALQTCLMTYNTGHLDKPIYALPLVMEYCETIDCEGSTIEALQNDLDIVTYNNYTSIDFEKYFWLDNNNKESGKWWDLEFRYNLRPRIENFFKFMNSPEFSDKSVAIYSHGGFIANIVNNNVDNYQTYVVEYDQETETATIKSSL